MNGHPRHQTNSQPVYLPPDGEQVGRVISGRASLYAPVKHIAFLGQSRIGTYDTLLQAVDVVQQLALRDARKEHRP